jgi:anti-sigma B factor antagonist
MNASGAAHLHFDRADDDGSAVLVLHGSLDLASATELHQELDGLVAEGWKTVVLDMSGVEFVNSTGLGVMVATTKQLRRVGGDLVLRSFRGIPSEALTVTGLDAFLTIES